MPFRIIVEKELLGKFWVNTYLVTAADLASAATLMTPIVNAERALYFGSILITKARVDDMTPDTDQFITAVYNLAGTRATSAQALPMFNTARVDFGVIAGGRPCRKYIRGFLQETDSDGTDIIVASRAPLQTYANTIVALGAVCDPQGNTLSSGAPHTAVQMRQVRRKKRPSVTL